ncbi:MAG: ABC transporter substrate-binding protein, partial [Bryobacteraceae bacterium]
AVEHANVRLGKGEKPYRLVSRWSDDPWRAGASAVARLALEDRIVALVGGIDSATTHLAEQVAAKMLFPVVDPVSTDETTNAAFVPWIFSWAPGDSLLARALAQGIARRPYTLLAATDHGSRQLARVLSRMAQPAERQDFQPPNRPPAPSHATVVVLAPPAALCDVVSLVPESAEVFCGPSAWSRACRGRLRRPVRAPALAAPDAALLRQAEARFQSPGDVYFQLAYESTALLLECIQAAGPNRPAVRERLASRFASNGRRPISSVLLQEVSPS